jgi:hypothetical protein
MSELDLDAIEALADEAWTVSDREAALDLVGVTRALVAEVRRLRALEAEVVGVRGIVAGWVGMDDQGGQWARGHRAASRDVLRELDGALGLK